MYIVHTGMHYVQFPNSADALGSLELYIVHTGYGLCTILVDPLRVTSCASLERPGSTRFHSPPHARAPWSSRSPSRFCPSPSGPPGKTPSDVATVMDFDGFQRDANRRRAQEDRSCFLLFIFDSSMVCIYNLPIFTIFRF